MDTLFLPISVISVLGITVLVLFLNRISPVRVCPVCVGVSGTWMWMMGARLFGYEIDLVIPAMLMGGSVVGVAYQLEKHVLHGERSFLWKSVFIPVGFVAAYSFMQFQWVVCISSVVFLVVWTLQHMPVKSRRNMRQTDVRKELEEKMKGCC